MPSTSCPTAQKPKKKSNDLRITDFITMPVGPGAGNASANQSRQTFRPPWVKDGPQPIPMPSQPWVKSNRNMAQNETQQETPAFIKPNLRRVSETPMDKGPPGPPGRKTSSITITPSQPKENGAAAKPLNKPAEPAKPPSKPAEPAKPPSKPAEPAKPPSKPAEAVKPVEAAKPPKPTDRRTSEVSVDKKPAEKPLERQSSKTRVLERSKTSDKYEGLPGPPKPPAPPMPPAPPPPPPSSQPPIKSNLTPEKAKKLEFLRSRPKRRPDWCNLMKEIESGKKLSHVQSNDRSAPLLPKVKAKGQFVYESERPNLHNQLLKQIETGVRLKPTKTNDRSKPFIEGLRKFRRQMTIEEQIQKSASMASMGVTEIEPDPLDEVDDIDKVRDDLQSTKQLLAIELKNKEALERENKKLVTKILNLEVELEKEKNKINTGATANNSELQQEIKSLREEANKAKKLADEMETKYHDVQGQYDLLKLDLEEATQKSQRLEKQLKVAQAANLANMSQGQPLAKQPSKKIVHQNTVHETPVTPDSPEESEEEETETETETESENEGDDEAQKERRLLREIKLLTTKLKSFKTKRENAKKERKALKEQMSKLQKTIKEEKKKFKVLQKEVDKMSKLLNEGEEEEEEEEEEEDEEEEEAESSEEEEESEESESEESEGDLPESAPPEKKKINLQNRAKKYENLLSSLKKGNYLLKANVDRYKDDLNKQKEMALTLQEDLNSVLAELG